MSTLTFRTGTIQLRSSGSPTSASQLLAPPCAMMAKEVDLGAAVPYSLASGVTSRRQGGARVRARAKLLCQGGINNNDPRVARKDPWVNIW